MPPPIMINLIIFKINAYKQELILAKYARSKCYYITESRDYKSAEGILSNIC